MGYVIQQEQVDEINRQLAGTDYVAKRGRRNPNEIIVGKDSDTAGCVTVILADNPSAGNIPMWYVGTFRSTTPKEVSQDIELPETPTLQIVDKWEKMVKSLKEQIVTI